MKRLLYSSLLLCLTILISCTTTQPTASESKTEKQSAKLTFLALGDSYTIGEAVTEEQSWPHLLVKELYRRDYAFLPPTILAKTGWRSDELLHEMDGIEAKEKFDMVSILIGVNNQYQGKSIEVFKEELNAIIDKAILQSKKGAKGIFAFSIPDYGVMPAMRGKDAKKIAKEIKAYNIASAQIYFQRGIPFYDITKISKGAKENAGLIANDKLHPSVNMYRMWVKEWTNSIINDVLK